MASTRRVQPRASEIGRRLRTIRRRRGLSQDHLAARAGISKPYLSQLENGLRAFERRSLIERLADALGCSIIDLTGEPYVPVDRVSAEGLATIPGIEHALNDCTLDDVPDIPARPVTVLAAAVDTANEQRDQVHYGTAGRELGALLTELQVIAATGGSADRNAALAALVEAGLVAYDLAKNLGHTALAVAAAERGHQAAHLLGDPVLIGFASRYRAMALMRIGAHRRANSILARAIEQLEPLADPTGLSARGGEVYGFLHLTSAVHAARHARGDDAHAHLAEASRVAHATGERNSFHAHFGPTNVALWSVSVGVELGEGAKATETAATIDTDVLGSRNRTGALHFDLARSFSQEGGSRDREAVQQLDLADRVAPARIRHDPIARSLLETLDSRARLQMWELNSLRHRFGVPGARG